MKFGKELAAQMVHEWQEAYVDYNYLKTLLKDVRLFRQRCSSPPSAAAIAKGGLKRRVSLYRAFSGLTTGRSRGSAVKNEDEVILVNAVQNEGSDSSEYHSMFLMLSDDGGEYELLFFKRLDHEFNKVLNFYKKKVEEVMVEADELSKQMNALIALRIKVDDPVVGGAKMINVDSIDGVSGNSLRVNPRTVLEAEMSSEILSEEPRIDKEDESNRHCEANGRDDARGFRPAPLKVLDHVKINITPETGVSTVKHILKSSKLGRSFNKQELKKVESQMARALVEFYRELQLLKNYYFLNQLALSKIMKKYDKITSRNASNAYLQMAGNSCLGSCDEVTKLMERVEATVVKHFTHGNRKKGMDILRPKSRRERHRYTFLSGLFSGSAIALMVAIFVLIHARNLLNSTGHNQYMENIFPLYSLFAFIALHMVMYAGNVYFWKCYRVNYPFIFGFKQGTELGYKEVLLVSSGLTVLTLAGVLSTLDMEMDPETQGYKAITELVPIALVIVVLLITICPFNVIYRSSRFFLIQTAFHSLCAPFYKVTLSDFFLADQLTSQVQAFRNLEFYICYYGWGDYQRRSNTCHGNAVFNAFYFIVAIIPYWIRFLQCLRRFFEEKDGMQALNGLRYVSTIIALAVRTSYGLNKGITWKILALTTSSIATIFGTYWDIVIDWGLLQRNSRNLGLRDKLLVPHKSVYFVAMVLNVILRLAWMQSVLDFNGAPFMHTAGLITIIACLEIIRRGIWNFFRLENEHLNNVGKYRAFKSVPLPFNYDDQEKNGVVNFQGKEDI